MRAAVTLCLLSMAVTFWINSVYDLIINATTKMNALTVYASLWGFDDGYI